jgi:stage II sporulation protein E
MREHEGAYDIIFTEREVLCSTSVKLTRPKGAGEGKRCGDSVSVLRAVRGFDYTVICDGMGSGAVAALTSTLASVFLTRLLQAGGRAESTLRMLNGFLAARSARDAESSTTVDLMEIDLVHSKAALFKCGAAPTYLLRRGEVSRFFSRTAPVGILEALDAERIDFDIMPGDVLVQISDGFSCGEEDCPWLAQMLAARYDGDAESFARMALNHASKEGDDDLSIVVTEIKAAAAEEAAAPSTKSA